MSAAEIAARRQQYARAMTAAIGAPALEDAFAAVPREAFMPPGPWTLLRMPGGAGTLSVNDPVALYPLKTSPEVLVVLDASRGINNGAPSLHAHMLHSLDVRPGQRVLHLGAGTGYYSAILGELAGRGGQVTVVEFVAALQAQAVANLGLWPQVRVLRGDAAEFPTDEIDRLYVNFAVADPPAGWFTRLAPHGIAVFPLVTGGGAVLVVRRVGEGFAARFLVPCGFIGAAGRLAGSPAHRARLDAAFAGAGIAAVQSLHLPPSRPSQAWFRGPGWTLSPDPVG